jgi:hypothetical protein
MESLGRRTEIVAKNVITLGKIPGMYTKEPTIQRFKIHEEIEMNYDLQRAFKKTIEKEYDINETYVKVIETLEDCETGHIVKEDISYEYPMYPSDRMGNSDLYLSSSYSSSSSEDEHSCSPQECPTCKIECPNRYEDFLKEEDMVL